MVHLAVMIHAFGYAVLANGYQNNLLLLRYFTICHTLSLPILLLSTSLSIPTSHSPLQFQTQQTAKLIRQCITVQQLARAMHIAPTNFSTVDGSSDQSAAATLPVNFLCLRAAASLINSAFLSYALHLSFGRFSISAAQYCNRSGVRTLPAHCLAAVSLDYPVTLIAAVSSSHYQSTISLSQYCFLSELRGSSVKRKPAKCSAGESSVKRPNNQRTTIIV